MESLHKNIHLMLEFLKASSLVLHFFLLYINYLPDDVIFDIAIYADDTTVSSKCDQAFDQWQQLELTSELESDLWDCGLGQEVACWFQCWENSIGFLWPVQ